MGSPAFSIAGKRVLITGASGFLGTDLAVALAKLNSGELTLLSRNPRPDLIPGARAVPLDLRDRSATFAFLRENHFDLVYHLAGKTEHGNRPGIYEEQFGLHVQTTINLTDAMAERPPERFIHFGSSMEYGDLPYPQLTSDREIPLSAYGVSKLAATRIVLARAFSEQFPAVVVRPFFIYGHGQREDSFLKHAIRAALDGREFPTTAGEQTRDFTPVSKFVNDLLTLTALPASKTVGEVFNICTGNEIRIREALEMLREIYPAFRPQIGAIAYRPSEIMHNSGSPFRPWTAEQARDALREFLEDQS